MSSIHISPRHKTEATRPNITLYSVLLGAVLAVLAGYLAVSGNWLIGVALMLAVPGLILLHKYPWLGVVIWVFTVPFFTITPDPAGRQIYWLVHRALPPVTVLVILLSSRLRINSRQLPRLGWPELAMAGYVVAGLFSIVLLNESPVATFFRFYDRVISPMSVYMIIRLWMPDEQDLKRLTPVIFLLLVVQLVIGLLAWYNPGLLPSAWIDGDLRTTGTLGSYGAYAATMIFSGLFLLRSGLNQKAGWARNLYLWAFLLAGFGVFLSFSRGAWAAGVLVILGLALIDQKRVAQFALVVIPLVYLLAEGPLAGQIAWAQERLYSQRAEQSALIRLPVYQASLRMLAAKPVFGWGYENFNVYDWQFYGPVEGLATPVKNLSSHNFYLTLLAEQGLLGTLLFLCPTLWWLMRSLKEFSRLPAQGFFGRNSLVLSWLFIFAYMTINMFHNMRVVFGLGLWWIGLALIANIVERHAGSSRPRSPLPPAREYGRLPR